MSTDQLSLLPAGNDGEPMWLDEQRLVTAAGEFIIRILQGERQPGASELLAQLLNQFGWPVRTVFLQAVQDLRSNTKLRRYIREYLSATLNEEEMAAALRGGAKPERDFESTVDDLVRKTKLFRSSKAFQDAITFTAKFRDYAPFNNMLVKVQNPSCSFFATARDWRERFNRMIKLDARPMLILAPMHPVMLVYELDATDGPPLPGQFESFGKARGEFNEEQLGRLIENARRHGILIERKTLSSTHAGYAHRLAAEDVKMRVVLHDKLDPPSAFAVLCHELAHILLGHLGSDADGWWPSRINLAHRTVEIEAEAVSYIVCERLGLEAESPGYLSSYITSDSIPETVSMELIAKISGKLEEMSQRLLAPRQRKARKTKKK